MASESESAAVSGSGEQAAVVAGDWLAENEALLRMPARELVYQGMRADEPRSKQTLGRLAVKGAIASMKLKTTLYFRKRDLESKSQGYKRGDYWLLLAIRRSDLARMPRSDAKVVKMRAGRMFAVVQDARHLVSLYRACPIGDRFFEEVIEKETPHRFYLDVERDVSALGPKEEAAREIASRRAFLLSHFIPHLCDFFSQLFGEEVRPEDWTVTDSSREGCKFSAHLVLATPRNHYFARRLDSWVAAALLCKSLEALADLVPEFSDWYRFDGGDKRIVDYCVYSEGARNMRMLGSCKPANGGTRVGSSFRASRPFLPMPGQEREPFVRFVATMPLRCRGGYLATPAADFVGGSHAVEGGAGKRNGRGAPAQEKGPGEGVAASDPEGAPVCVEVRDEWCEEALSFLESLTFTIEGDDGDQPRRQQTWARTMLGLRAHLRKRLGVSFTAYAPAAPSGPLQGGAVVRTVDGADPSGAASGALVQHMSAFQENLGRILYGVGRMECVDPLLPPRARETIAEHARKLKQRFLYDVPRQMLRTLVEGLHPQQRYRVLEARPERGELMRVRCSTLIPGMMRVDDLGHEKPQRLCYWSYEKVDGACEGGGHEAELTCFVDYHVEYFCHGCRQRGTIVASPIQPHAIAPVAYDTSVPSGFSDGYIDYANQKRAPPRGSSSAASMLPPGPFDHLIEHPEQFMKPISELAVGDEDTGEVREALFVHGEKRTVVLHGGMGTGKSYTTKHFLDRVVQEIARDKEARFGLVSPSTGSADASGGADGSDRAAGLSSSAGGAGYGDGGYEDALGDDEGYGGYDQYDDPFGLGGGGADGHGVEASVEIEGRGGPSGTTSPLAGPAGTTSPLADNVDLRPRVLSITFRQMLAQHSAKAFGLRLYSDGDLPQKLYDEPMLAIQMDSLGRLLDDNPDEVHYKMRVPDVLIFDESESNLAHLDSETLDSKRMMIWKLLRALLSSANTVIFADADLGPRTRYVIMQTRGVAGAVPNLEYHRNPFIRNKLRYMDYKGFAEWLKVLVRSVLVERRKVFVFGNHRLRLNAIQRFVEEEALRRLDAGTETEEETAFLQDFLERRVKLLDSSISGNEKRTMAEDCNVRWRELSLLLVSPVIGAGISFDEEHFDEAFGYGCLRSCCPRELNQMGGRVRKLRLNRWHLYFETGQVVEEDVMVPASQSRNQNESAAEGGAPFLDPAQAKAHAALVRKAKSRARARVEAEPMYFPDMLARLRKSCEENTQDAMGEIVPGIEETQGITRFARLRTCEVLLHIQAMNRLEKRNGALRFRDDFISVLQANNPDLDYRFNTAYDVKRNEEVHRRLLEFEGEREREEAQISGEMPDLDRTELMVAQRSDQKGEEVHEDPEVQEYASFLLRKNEFRSRYSLAPDVPAEDMAALLRVCGEHQYVENIARVLFCSAADLYEQAKQRKLLDYTRVLLVNESERVLQQIRSSQKTAEEYTPLDYRLRYWTTVLLWMGGFECASEGGRTDHPLFPLVGHDKPMQELLENPECCARQWLRAHHEVLNDVIVSSRGGRPVLPTNGTDFDARYLFKLLRAFFKALFGLDLSKSESETSSPVPRSGAGASGAPGTGSRGGGAAGKPRARRNLCKQGHGRYGNNMCCEIRPPAFEMELKLAMVRAYVDSGHCTEDWVQGVKGLVKRVCDENAVRYLPHQEKVPTGAEHMPMEEILAVDEAQAERKKMIANVARRRNQKRKKGDKEKDEGAPASRAPAAGEDRHKSKLARSESASDVSAAVSVVGSVADSVSSAGSNGSRRGGKRDISDADNFERAWDQILARYIGPSMYSSDVTPHAFASTILSPGYKIRTKKNMGVALASMRDKRARKLEEATISEAAAVATRNLSMHM